MTFQEKWKKAVVHLEGRSNSVSVPDRNRALREFVERLGKGEADISELGPQLLAGTRDVIVRGTAVFIQHNDARYLLTARHVIHNETEADAILQKVFEEISEGYLSTERAKEAFKVAIEESSNLMHETVFRVPQVDDEMSDPVPELLAASVGVPNEYPFTFSEPDLDLAVLALDQGFGWNEFGDDLEAKGHVPIDLDDIADEPSAEGEEVFTVGFPGSTSVIGERDMSETEIYAQSSGIAIPVFAFGKVAAMHDSLDYFWCDISAYPGNSGGPIIANDKLVGIVSHQATVEDVRIPFGLIIKGEYAIELIEQQEAKGQASQGTPESAT